MQFYFILLDNNAGTSWGTTSYWMNMGHSDPNPEDVLIPLLFVYSIDGGDIKTLSDADPTLILRLGYTEGMAYYKCIGG